MAGALEPGSSISHYRVISLLGAGGMGEVYKAHDATLDRTVALKILPPELVRNDERVRRFIQEAKSASSLNHPHIVTIHEIGRVDLDGDVEKRGLHFIAMELIDGQTLESKIHAPDSDLRTLLVCLSQAAEGLAKAHSAGIVHRDLKPQNIMISRDGYAKVLDFGLAKLNVRKGVDGEASSATEVRGHTREGTVLGTAAYMSPEQVQGKVVDHRSDIFSFGCILYETATGTKPFDADSDIDIMHKIVHDKPTPIDEINPRVPAELRRLIRRCLAKDPEKRYQSIKDVAIDLSEIVTEFDDLSVTQSSRVPGSTSISSPAFAPARRSGPWIIAGAIVAVLAATIGVIEWKRSHASTAAAGALQSMRIERITNSGNVVHAAISPDGRYVAHVVQDENLEFTLFVRQAATSSDVRLVGPFPNRIVFPRFSPDGNYIDYDFYDGAGPGAASLYRVAALGGTPRKLLFDIDSPVSFSPDGKRFSFGRGVLTRSENDILVAAIDGTSETVVAKHKRISTGAVSPIEAVWSADGKTIVTAKGSTTGGLHDEIVEIDVKTGVERAFGSPWVKVLGVAWLPNGKELVVAGIRGEGARSQLWLQPYPDGEPRRITNDLNFYVNVTVSANGKTLSTVQTNGRSRLYAAAITDERGGDPLIPELRDILVQSVSASSTGRIAYAAVSAGSSDIWLLEPDGSQKQLTTDGRNGAPAISADGRVIAFLSGRDSGVPHIWLMDGDGSRARQLTHGENEGRPAISPDGRWVVYPEIGKGLYRMATSGGTPLRVANVRSRTWPAISRDARLIAYNHWTAGEPPHWLAVIGADGGKAVLDVPFGTGIADIGTVCWTPAGDGITYDRIERGAHNIWKQPLDGSALQQLTHFKTGVITSHAWLPDGRLVFTRRATTSDVVLVSDFH